MSSSFAVPPSGSGAARGELSSARADIAGPTVIIRLVEMKSLVTSASLPSRRMVSPIVDSDMVAARCNTGTIQQARPMNTSVVARPIRMIASDGEGRFRKRAIAPKNTSTNSVMAPTRP